MEKQRQIKILSIVALVLAISAMTLGFAAFSTTLNISSSASVTPNSADFAVKFSTSQTSLVDGDVSPNLSDDGVSATKAKITNGATPSLSNLSATFSKPGQYVVYQLYIKNEGAYTAYLNNINFLGEKTCIAAEETTESLVQSACDSMTIKVYSYADEYTETTKIENRPLEKGKASHFVIRLAYESDGTPVDGSFKISFPSISLVYSTVDDSSMNGQVVRVVSGDINTIGSVVAIGNEQFYVYGKENGNVKLLSMYNLRVGNSADENKNITVLSNPTGIQDTDAKGFVRDEKKYIGTSSFSDSSNKGTYYSDYEGSLVEKYVNNYKTYLINLGANISNARLITKSELETLGCISNDESCSDAPSWVYSTSYWTGTAYSSSDTFFVFSYARFGNAYCLGEALFGVRPVIEIPTSEFE